MVTAQRVEPETFEVTNPATGRLIERIPIHDAAHVEAEMQRARAAQRRWAQVPIEERCRRVQRVQKIMMQEMDSIAETIVHETGKVEPDALLHEVGAVVGCISYFTRRGPSILADEPIDAFIMKHRKSYLSYQPKGVIGVISPWNFPFMLPGCDTIMALIAGNAVVIKPSEITPRSALRLAACIHRAGIDPDLVRVVTGLGGTGAALIASRPDHIVFTGSVPTGKKIAVACAERLIPCTLELGGKGPAIVLSDANLERTASAIVWGGFVNAGQVCASVERVYAQNSLYDALVEKVVEKTRALKVGPPHEGTDVGSLTFAPQRDIVARLVEDAEEKGARVLTGGRIPAGLEHGLYYEPTIVADANHDMKIMKEEIFGPAIPFMRVHSEAEAIELANDSHLGLGGYVFTEDETRGQRVAEQLEVGSVMINDVIAHAGLPEVPWGGIKESGVGVVRSDRGLKELCNARHVNYGRVSSGLLDHEPVWFPYSARTRGQVKRVLKTVFGDGVTSRVLRKLL